MLQEPFDTHIQGSIIFWNFSLKDENDPNMDYFQVPEPKRSLHDLIKDLNYQLQLKIEQLERKPENPDRARRKFVKHILKNNEAKLSTYANEVSSNKDILRKFFKKQDLEPELKEEISEKFKCWLEPVFENLPQDQILSLSAKFVKSYFKESEARLQSKFVDDIYLIYMDKFVPFSKQLSTESSNLIQIDLNLSVEDRAITDSFLWDPERTHELDIWMYTKYLLNDLLMEYDIITTKEQFQNLHEETRIQLRTQLQYKLLLQKYKSLLVSFATMDTNEVKQYTIPIEVRVMDNDGNLIYSDDFQWDILNESNNVEQFCEILIKDEGIPQQYLSEISEQIRTQIYNQLNWRFICLSNTFKSLLKQRELPKQLKNQSTGQIKKNIIFTLDMPLPINPENISTSPVQFHNSEMYSVLSKNFDLLPQSYQKIIHQEKSVKEDLGAPQLQKTKSIPKSLFRIQGNPYLPTNVISQFDSNKVRSIFSGLLQKDR